jgi:Flp pilus assembly pilin Flp
MPRMFARLEALARSEHGQDLMEYALLAAIIAVGAFVAMNAAGNAISGILWQYVVANI